MGSKIEPRPGAVIGSTGSVGGRKLGKCLIRVIIGLSLALCFLLLVVEVAEQEYENDFGGDKSDMESAPHFENIKNTVTPTARNGEGDERNGLDGGGCQMKGSFEKALPPLKVKRGRHDNQRLIRIFDFHQTGVEWEAITEQYDVCLATQSTLERIYWLPHLLHNWSGPLSLALYVTYVEEWLVWNLFSCYLSRCHVGFSERVAVHVVFPNKALNHSDALVLTSEILAQWNVTSLEEVAWTLLKEDRGDVTCPDPKVYLNLLLHYFPTVDLSKLALKEVYPQNHMRNVARKGCPTTWTISVDVDVIPRRGMAEMVQQFLNDNHSDGDSLCDKCAYVIPVFELKDTLPFPSTKGDLVHNLLDGTARPYHSVTFPPAQFATNYPRWAATFPEESKGDAPPPVVISHEVGELLLRYEPFFLAPDHIPPFDERFLGYGYTRSSQVQQALAAEWKFKVLSPPFLIHWGLVNDRGVQLFPKKRGVGKNVRWQQTRANRHFYEQLEQELQLKKEAGLI